MARRGVRLILAVLLAVSTESGSVGGPQGTTLSEPGTREFGEGWRGAPEEVRLRGARACERARSVDSLGLRGPWCARLRGGQQESHQTDTDTKTQVLGEGVPFLTGLDEHLGRLAEEDEDDRPPENFPEDDCIEYRGHGVGEASSEPEVVLEEEEEDADVREATFLMQMGRSAPMEAVQGALEMAALQPHDILVDLGCGDGRVCFRAVEEYNCSALGIDLDFDALREAESIRTALGFEDQVQFEFGDLTEFNLTRCSVAFLYAPPEMFSSGTRMHLQLLEFLRSGGRVLVMGSIIDFISPVASRTFSKYLQVYLYSKTSVEHPILVQDPSEPGNIVAPFSVDEERDAGKIAQDAFESGMRSGVLDQEYSRMNP